MRRPLSPSRRRVARAGRAARIGLAAVLGLGATLTVAVPGIASGGNEPLIPPAGVLSDTRCVQAPKATFTHTFRVDQRTHQAIATIRLDNRLCRGQEQAFTLVSYLAPAAGVALPRYLFDRETVHVTGQHPAFALRVDVPECSPQVDFVFGERVVSPITAKGDRYGRNRVGSDSGNGSRSIPAPGSQKHAWFHGAAAGCPSLPSVELAAGCDGSVRLSLRHRRGSASTTYVITGGAGYRVEVEASRSDPVAQVTVASMAARHLTVATDGRTVKEYAWTRPPGCIRPTVTATSDCSGASVTIANPATNAPVEATIRTAGQALPQTVTVGAGTSQTVDLASGVTVSVSVFGTTTVFEFRRPASCEASMLPVTGTGTALLAAVAVLLVASGTALFRLARRRRVRFTA